MNGNRPSDAGCDRLCLDEGCRQAPGLENDDGLIVIVAQFGISGRRIPHNARMGLRQRLGSLARTLGRFTANGRIGRQTRPFPGFERLDEIDRLARHGRSLLRCGGVCGVGWLSERPVLARLGAWRFTHVPRDDSGAAGFPRAILSLTQVRFGIAWFDISRFVISRPGISWLDYATVNHTVSLRDLS